MNIQLIITSDNCNLTKTIDTTKSKIELLKQIETILDVVGYEQKVVKEVVHHEGDYDCSRNNLTSLVSSPTSVGRHFNCSYNNLTSLEGCPTSVGGGFYCYNNKLSSLVGSPTHVGGNFYCSYNNLTTLEGCPSSVGGHFVCSNNPVKFTEEQVRAVCDVKGDVYV